MKFFIYAINGILISLKTERNIKIHFILGSLVILSGFIFNINLLEWSAVLLCIGMVISAEMINTAIEKLCDLYTTNYNKDIKVIKDISAGAVLICSIISFVVGTIIFLPKILFI